MDKLVGGFGERQPCGPRGGGIASHFHIRQDGRRVVNHSEWTTPEAHQEVVETQLTEDSGMMRLVRSVEGLTARGFRRLLPYRGVERPLP